MLELCRPALQIFDVVGLCPTKNLVHAHCVDYVAIKSLAHSTH